QREAACAQGLRLVDPGDAKSLERLDRIRSMILHAAENDEAVARRLDLVGIDLEAGAEAKRGDLALDQPLGGLCQRALRLADADRERAALSLASLDQKLAEEVRLARAPAPESAFVASGREQRLKHPRCRNSQGRQ